MVQSKQTHIIHKQIIDVHLGSKAEAKDWQDKISIICKEFESGQLDHVFNEICGPDEHIRIERLDIDLGKISATNFEHEFEAELVKSFEEELVNIYFRKLEFILPADQQESLVPSGVTEISPQTRRKQEIFYHYFKKGILPWWEGQLSIGEARKEWNAYISSAAIELKQVIHDLSGNKHTIRRLLFFTDEDTLLSQLDKTNEWKLREVYYEVLKVDKSPDIKLNFFEQFIRYRNISTRPIPETMALLAMLSLKKSSSDFGQTIQSNQSTNLLNFKSIFGESLSSSRAAMLHKFSEDTISKILSSNQPLEDLIDGNHSENKSFAFKQDIVNSEETSTKPHSGEEGPLAKSPVSSLDSGESLIIPNAGAVLLWPYLEMFYLELGIVKEKQFTNEGSQHLAVQLLHFLTTGTEKAAEWDWSLFKLMCGLKIGDFVAPEFQLANEQKGECYNLLNAVIRNWGVLKNTKPATLQASFLCREGLLKNEEHGWIVDVKRTGIDVLLDKLSWPISVIRLPWNNYMIHVQW